MSTLDTSVRARGTGWLQCKTGFVFSQHLLGPLPSECVYIIYICVYMCVCVVGVGLQLCQSSVNLPKE